MEYANAPLVIQNMKVKSKALLYSGVVAIIAIFSVVFATISYTATFNASVTGTTSSTLLSFSDTGTDVATLGGTFTEGDPLGKGGGFTITGLQVPADTITTFAVVSITNNGDVAVSVAITVTDGSSSEVAVSLSSATPVTLNPGESSIVEVTIDASDGSSGALIDFSMQFDVTTP